MFSYLSEISCAIVTFPLAKDVPNSPCKKLNNHLKYCWYNGKLRPNSSLKALKESSVAACPNLICAASPGKALVPKNITIETPRVVSRPAAILVKIIRNIISFS